MTHYFPTRRSADLDGLRRSVRGKLRRGPRLGARRRRGHQSASERPALPERLRPRPLRGVATMLRPFILVVPAALLVLPACEAIKTASREIGEREQPVRERSEEHTSELQSLMRISYAVFC